MHSPTSGSRKWSAAAYSASGLAAVAIAWLAIWLLR